MDILSVRIDEITHAKAEERVLAFLTSGVSHMIVTPNPEMLVKASRDVFFTSVLNASSLSLCDGFGLWLVTRLKKGTVERISGVDFMIDLCRMATERGEKVFLLGSGSERALEKTCVRLKEQFPTLTIVGTDPGPDITEREDGSLALDPIKNDAIINIIRREEPSVLLVAFGMGKQEKWIHQYLAALPSVRVAVGLGGAFDFVSGVVPRAPLLLRKIGLEWAYRLVVQPWRIKRIWNAVIIFPWYVMRARIAIMFEVK